MLKLLRIFVVTSLVALMGVAVPVSAGSIKIGFNVPLTGFAAADGSLQV